MAFSPLVWLAIGIVFLSLEIIVPGFVVFWLGVGSLITSLGIFLDVIPAGSAEIQWLVFLLSSLSLLVLWHFYFKKYFGNEVVDDARDPTVSELKGRIVKPIAPGIPGEVELYTYYHGIKRWQAESDESLFEGDEITVLEARGIKLKVKRKEE